jgi:galacturonokinase
MMAMGIQPFPTIDEQAEGAAAAWQRSFTIDPAEARQLFVPYRICPLGAHIDHQGGPVLGRTVPTGTLLLYTPLDEPIVQLVSPQFVRQLSFPIGSAIARSHWGRYAQAAALALGQEHLLRRGFAGAVSGSLVGAGLASSASVGLAYLQALADVNGISLTRSDLVDLDLDLEHIYLGLNNGIQDQSNILHGTDNALVYTDTRRRRATLIPDPPESGQAAWLIVFSGVTRELTVGGGFNQRVLECRQAARWLREDAEILSDVPRAAYDTAAASMPEALRLRAAHFYSEVERVADGLEAWQKGNLIRFGELMNLSCESSIHQYQSAQEPIISLQRIVREGPGVYGSRFSGGGYGGCVVALVKRDKAELAAANILSRYRRIFPQHAGNAAIYRAGRTGQ